MLLTIDAGNTNIVFTVFDGDKGVFESRIDTNAARMADQYAITLNDILRLYGVDVQRFTGAIISSVVPPVTRNIAAAINSLTKLSPLIVEPGLKTGLNIKIDNPAELGADLVCGAVAAKSMFPSPCVAIDLGTVTKVMALDSDGALIGGVLAPGVGVGCKMMSESTALLPLVGFGASKVPDPPIIGTNTVDCIKGGVLFGTACMLDGLITRFERQIGSKCSIVATGGFAEIIVPHCEHKVEVCQSLVSQGLRIIYNKNALHS